MSQTVYEVTCECGHAMLITATKAGARVECPCGRTVVVPALSELRRSAPVVGRRPSSTRAKPSLTWVQVTAVTALVLGGEAFAALAQALGAVAIGQPRAADALAYLGYPGHALSFCGIVAGFLLYRASRTVRATK